MADSQPRAQLANCARAAAPTKPRQSREQQFAGPMLTTASNDTSTTAFMLLSDARAVHTSSALQTEHAASPRFGEANGTAPATSGGEGHSRSDDDSSTVTSATVPLAASDGQTGSKGRGASNKANGTRGDGDGDGASAAGQGRAAGKRQVGTTRTTRAKAKAQDQATCPASEATTSAHGQMPVPAAGWPSEVPGLVDGADGEGDQGQVHSYGLSQAAYAAAAGMSIGQYDLPSRLARLERWHVKRSTLSIDRAEQVRIESRSAMAHTRKREGGRFMPNKPAAGDWPGAGSKRKTQPGDDEDAHAGSRAAVGGRGGKKAKAGHGDGNNEDADMDESAFYASSASGQAGPGMPGGYGQAGPYEQWPGQWQQAAWQAGMYGQTHGHGQGMPQPAAGYGPGAYPAHPYGMGYWPGQATGATSGAMTGMPQGHGQAMAHQPQAGAGAGANMGYWPGQGMVQQAGQAMPMPMHLIMQQGHMGQGHPMVQGPMGQIGGMGWWQVPCGWQGQGQAANGQANGHMGLGMGMGHMMMGSGMALPGPWAQHLQAQAAGAGARGKAGTTVGGGADGPQGKGRGGKAGAAAAAKPSPSRPNAESSTPGRPTLDTSSGAGAGAKGATGRTPSRSPAAASHGADEDEDEGDATEGDSDVLASPGAASSTPTASSSSGQRYSGVQSHHTKWEGRVYLPHAWKTAAHAQAVSAAKGGEGPRPKARGRTSPYVLLQCNTIETAALAADLLRIAVLGQVAGRLGVTDTSNKTGPGVATSQSGKLNFPNHTMVQAALAAAQANPKPPQDMGAWREATRSRVATAIALAERAGLVPQPQGLGGADTQAGTSSSSSAAASGSAGPAGAHEAGVQQPPVSAVTAFATQLAIRAAAAVGQYAASTV